MKIGSNLFSKAANRKAAFEEPTAEALSRTPDEKGAGGQESKTESQIYALWTQQAKEARKLYPKLDLARELRNKDFGELLLAGIDVRTAFEVVHKDEIIPAAMYYAASQVEQKLTNKLLAGARRPGENGSASGPAVSNSDVSRLTRQERREIIRRVQRGETISF